MPSPSITAASGPPSSGYTPTHNIDPRYRVTLTVSGDGGMSTNFETSIDETLSVALSAQWSAPFENMIGDMVGGILSRGGTLAGRAGAAASGGMVLTGHQLRWKPTTARVWQTSSPMELTIPFTFVAINDPVADVKQKAVDLLKLCAPSESGMIIKAPGPVLMDQMSKEGTGRIITLQIGDFITLKPCIVENVQVQFENVIGERGIPLRAKVNVDIKSWYTLFTTQDIDEMFAGR